MPHICSMKKLIITLTVLTQLSFSYAQTYVPFPDSNAIWNETPESGSTSYCEPLGLIGDTIINSVQYHKIYVLEDTILNIPNSTYYGALREDSLKRIYYFGYTLWDTSEVLLYDFSVNIGDSIQYGVSYKVVSDIDSVLVGNQYRKRFHFQWVADSLWIEGIGSTKGLLFPHTGEPLLGSRELICFKQEDSISYLNSNYNKCFCPIYDNIGDEGELYSDHISIYPNPMTDYCVFDLEGLSMGYNTLELYNQLGEVVMRANIGRERKIKLDKNGFTSAFYCYRIFGSEDKVISGKLIVY